MRVCDHCGSEIPAGARFCPGCAAPVADEPPSQERKLATVLFADLVGSTELSGSQDAERTRALLDRFYDAMTEEVERAGGTIEKFAGDAVMVAFGAPSALEDHAERALHAALAMQRRLAELFEGQLELRVGVNTGEVVVGEARVGSSFVSGDAVNVAARLEQAAAPGAILVGERTVAAARGAFEFERPVNVDAKGKPQGVVAQRVVRALSMMRPRGVGGLAQSFVGRDRELERLGDAYRATVDQRRPRLVTILGDAGVGKTRLTRELWQRLSEQTPEPLRRTGRCLSYGTGTAYWALGEVLKEHLGLVESDPPEVALDRLGARQILGLTLGLDVARDLHPLAARDRLQDAWAELLTDVVAERPAVLLIEDVHWAETQLLDVLEYVLGRAEGPLLVIVTARPELPQRRPGWGARAGELLELEPLSAQDSVRMLSEMLAGGLPAELGELVVERAEGNPFFVEELLGVLIDRGLLVRENGGWVLRELPDEFAVPDSVQAVLAARIDLLGPAEKSALQAAAVIGRVFWTGPVYELVEATPDLRVLEDRDLVRRRAGSSMSGEREYVIKHALTREVAYQSLPRSRRPRMHAVFATWLERRAPGREDLASLIAHHYAEAVRAEDADLAWAGKDSELERLRGKAVLWLEAAAQSAMRRYEIDGALELLGRALSLKADEETEARVWRAVGKANALKFDGEAFWTAMESSLKVCSNKATCAETYSELAFQTAIRSSMWDKRPDRELVAGWIEQALELSEPGSDSRARALIARSFWDRNTPEAAREASELAERSGDIELRSYAWGARSTVAFGEADFEAALSWSQRRLNVKDEISDPDHVAEIYELVIPSCCANARFAEARRLATEHDAVVEPLSDHHRLHGIAVLLEVEELCGGWGRILDLADRTRVAVEANLTTPCVRNARALLVTALAAAYSGDEETARQYEGRAEEVATEGYELVLAAPRTWLALLRGEIDEVDRLEPIDLARVKTEYALPAAAARLDALAALKERSLVERDAPPLLQPGRYLEPFALRALGVVREDEQLVEQAADRFDAMGLEWHAEQTRKHLAPIWPGGLGLGSRDEA
jgi:class 3 adenylate cyclase